MNESSRSFSNISESLDTVEVHGPVPNDSELYRINQELRDVVDYLKQQYQYVLRELNEKDAELEHLRTENLNVVSQNFELKSAINDITVKHLEEIQKIRSESNRMLQQKQRHYSAQFNELTARHLQQLNLMKDESYSQSSYVSIDQQNQIEHLSQEKAELSQKVELLRKTIENLQKENMQKLQQSLMSNPVEQQNQKLKEKINEQHQQIQLLAEETSSQSRQLKDKERRVQEVQSELRRQEEKYRLILNENTKLDSILREFEQRNRESSEKSMRADEHVEYFQQRNRELEQQVSELVQARDEARAEAKRLQYQKLEQTDHLQHSLAQMEEKNRIAEERINTLMHELELHSQGKERMQQEINRLLALNKDLSTRATKLKEQGSSITSISITRPDSDKVQEYKNLVESTSKLNQQLNSEIARCYAYIEQLKRQSEAIISDADRQLRNLDAEIYELKNKENILNRQISDLQLKLKNMQTNNQGLSKLCEELKNQKTVPNNNSNDVDRNVLLELASKTEEIQQLTGKLEEVRNANQILQRRLQEIEGEISSVQERASELENYHRERSQNYEMQRQRIESLESIVRQKQRQVKELNNRLKGYEEEFRNKEIVNNTLTEIVNNKDKDLETVEEEYRARLNKLHAEATAALGRKDNEIEQLHTQIHALNSMLELKEGEKTKLQNLQTEYECLSSLKVELCQKLENAERHIHELEEAINSNRFDKAYLVKAEQGQVEREKLRMENVQLQDNMHKLMDECRRLTEENDVFREHMNAQTKELENLAVMTEEAHERIKTGKAENDRLLRRVADLQTQQNSTKQEAQNKVQQSRQSLETQMNILQTANKNLVRELEDAKGDLELKDQKIQILKMDLQDVKTKAQEADRKRIQQENKNKRMTEQLNLVREQLEHKTIDYDILLERFEQLKTENQQQLEDMNSKLEMMNEKFENEQKIYEEKNALKFKEQAAFYAKLNESTLRFENDIKRLSEQKLKYMQEIEQATRANNETLRSLKDLRADNSQLKIESTKLKDELKKKIEDFADIERRFLQLTQELDITRRQLSNRQYPQMTTIHETSHEQTTLRSQQIPGDQLMECMNELEKKCLFLEQINQKLTLEIEEVQKQDRGGIKEEVLLLRDENLQLSREIKLLKDELNEISIQKQQATIDVEKVKRLSQLELIELQNKYTSEVKSLQNQIEKLNKNLIQQTACSSYRQPPSQNMIGPAKRQHSIKTTYRDETDAGQRKWGTPASGRIEAVPDSPLNFQKLVPIYQSSNSVKNETSAITFSKPTYGSSSVPVQHYPYGHYYSEHDKLKREPSPSWTLQKPESWNQTNRESPFKMHTDMYTSGNGMVATTMPHTYYRKL